jgi:hypothetical protein
MTPCRLRRIRDKIVIVTIIKWTEESEQAKEVDLCHRCGNDESSDSRLGV